MQTLKITTKDSNIASVHSGDIQNISRLYQVVVTLSGEYGWLFSKPKFEKDKILWQSELEGEGVNFAEADESLQESIKSTLKKAIYSIIYFKNQEQIGLLKDVIEIPDTSDIWYIGGKVVLTQWGHIKNAYNARRGVIFDLIGGDGIKLNLKLLENSLPVDGVEVEFVFMEHTFKAVSDINGEVNLFLPKNEDILLVVEGDKRSINLSEDSYLEINLSEKSAPPPPQQEEIFYKEEIDKKEPFIIKVWDCENNTFVVGDGELLVKVDSRNFKFKIKNGAVEIDDFFGKEILVESLVKGYTTKSQTKFKVQSKDTQTLCLYPMIELKTEGAIGDPRFNISWSPSPEDIDIMVVTPCGNLIYYAEKEKFCDGFKGMLDIDIREIECQDRDEDCQENITFDNSGPRGEYLIVVKKYSGSSNPTDITLTIVNNGEKSIEKFTLKEVDDEKRFKIIH